MRILLHLWTVWLPVLFFLHVKLYSSRFFFSLHNVHCCSFLLFCGTNGVVCCWKESKYVIVPTLFKQDPSGFMTFHWESPQRFIMCSLQLGPNGSKKISEPLPKQADGHWRRLICSACLLNANAHRLTEE